MDDLSRQIDEIEALSSIYEKEWRTIDESTRTYKVSIASECENFVIVLELNLPVTYPSEMPPNYIIIAPWLRDIKARDQLRLDLDEIYLENKGEDIIFLWIEKIKEFLNDMSTKSKNSKKIFDQNLSVINTVKETLHINVPEIIHGLPFTDRKSTFQAHLSKITKVSEVKLVLSELLKNRKIENATHNIMAYRISGQGSISSSPVILQDCDDDGESAAGGRMLHLLQILDVSNVMVVVSRWYGGIQLGPDRFKHINNMTRDILLNNGFVKEKKKNK